MTTKKIFVTRPYLPPLEEFIPYLEKIWDNRILTNGGPFHVELENALCQHLGIEHISLFTNGTLALVTALQALRITGEVITTPYSFVATAHSLLWNGIQPVFVDIDPKTFNISADLIESAITPRTTAILPVHCYGSPCAMEAIERIADNYNLKVIYDAAHAFGVEQDGKSVLRHGDLSVLSFHATKIFNTFEGGAIVCPNAKTKQHIDHLKNFGFANETTVVAPGINGKMSEINAAIGLLQLKHTSENISARRNVAKLYCELLTGIPGIMIPEINRNASANHSYFPIFITEDFKLSRDELYFKLRESEIFARRYFYPLISEFPMYRGLPSSRPENLTNASRASRQVICLPIYNGIETGDIERIANAIRRSST